MRFDHIPVHHELDRVSAESRLDVSVIVPTYCEADNIAELVTRLNRTLSEARLRFEIVIVDDASPDETEALVDSLGQRYPLRLEVRTDVRGLSGAVLHGMSVAAGDILVVIDADLSHPPESIPQLVRAITDGRSEFAVGSRYISAGGTDAAWPWRRRLLSQLATWLAQPLASICDPMAGFFALRRRTYLANVDRFDPIGYKIGLEIIVKCRLKPIAEIPIVFQDRTRGTSKLTFWEGLRFLQHLARLYYFRLTDSGVGNDAGMERVNRMHLRPSRKRSRSAPADRRKR